MQMLVMKMSSTEMNQNVDKVVVVTQPPSVDGNGLRYNDGKVRFDLVPPFAQEQYAKVLTIGAAKYGDRNWERGMAWTKVIASMERHIHAIKSGDDYDMESGLLHSAHIMCNAAFLTEYYRIFPHGDNRPCTRLSETQRIGLDIDEVLAHFTKAYCQRYNLPIDPLPAHWDFDPLIKQRFEELKLDKQFWMDIEPMIDPTLLKFEPCCYITSRPIETHEWTIEWLQKHKFPNVPLITTVRSKKLEVARNQRVTLFVDDCYETFMKLNKNNMMCYLFDAPHNRRYNVGHKRLMGLEYL